jgi:hypothetical protein
MRKVCDFAKLKSREKSPGLSKKIHDACDRACIIASNINTGRKRDYAVSGKEKMSYDKTDVTMGYRLLSLSPIMKCTFPPNIPKKRLPNRRPLF